MEITKEESEAYVVGIQFPTPSMLGDMVRALRRHVAAEMRLEFENLHGLHAIINPGNAAICWSCGVKSVWDRRHNFTADDWDRAAHEAPMGGYVLL